MDDHEDVDHEIAREREIQRIRAKAVAYRRKFLGDEGKPDRDAMLVLADLKRFCRATESTLMVSPITGQVDPVASAAAEGRREVWLRINAYLRLDDRTTMNLEEPTNE